MTSKTKIASIQEVSSFPKLMILKKGDTDEVDTVMLMIGPESGIVVSNDLVSEEPFYAVGYACDTWQSGDSFIDFQGTVTIGTES